MEETYVVTKYGIKNKQDSRSGDIIREISSKETLEDLMERLPYIQTIQAPNARIRKELYELAMSEYDDMAWVKVIKSVYLRMEEKRYDDFEPEYSEKAKAFLHGEMAIQFHISPEEVEEYLIKAVEKQLKEF